MIHDKYQTFQKDWENVKDFIGLETTTVNAIAKAVQQQEFFELYNLVLSRTTNLGPEWGNQLGK
jgi:hypothetical protein